MIKKISALKSGFTLIELMVVVALLAMMAVIVLFNISSSRAKGVDAGIKSNLNSFRSRAEIIYLDNGNSYRSSTTFSEKCPIATDNIGGILSDIQNINILKEDGIPIWRLYLFGSYLSNKFMMEESDIDLAVFFDKTK
ncbi:MAG: prepilin-type N-terminal cleavage/methylation domain-containing protein, partial [Patescibacteria group bacterium]